MPGVTGSTLNLSSNAVSRASSGIRRIIAKAWPLFARSERRTLRENKNTMKAAYLCDGVRTPIGRYGGVLASVRADDLAAIPIRALIERNPNVDWSAIDDLYFGCA